MARRPPETTRLIRGRSPHISFAVHMRELAEEKKNVCLLVDEKVGQLLFQTVVSIHMYQ